MCKQQERKIMHAEVMMLLWNQSLIQNPQRQPSEGQDASELMDE